MGFLNSHLLVPTEQYLSLLEFLAVMMYMIHLPYIGIVLGSTAIAMWFTFTDHENPNAIHARFAGDLIETFLGNRLVMLMFGFFPLLVFPLIYAQWFMNAPATPLHYLPLCIVPVVIAFLALLQYRKTFQSRGQGEPSFKRHMAFGAIGVGLLKISYLVFLGSVVRLHDPEKWFRIKNILIMLLNFNVAWKFAVFAHVAAAMTGCAIVFFLLLWPGTRVGAGDSDYTNWVRKFGAGFALAFCFAIPVFNLFYVFTSPDVVFDSTVYVLSAGVCVLAMIAGLNLVTLIRSGELKHGATAFVVMLILLAFSTVADVRSMSNANREHRILLSEQGEKALAQKAAAHASGASEQGSSH